MEVLTKVRVGCGSLTRCKHSSSSTSTAMEFAVFVPDAPVVPAGGFPVIYYLSGLTCTDKNFSEKGGAFPAAAKAGVALVMPDTSPRGAGIAGEDESYDFGSGAGFYIDATAEPWSKNYNMFSYVTQELPALVQAEFPLSSSLQSIMGHSMGGHGALTIALKTSAYTSVSAFAPICNPTKCPWGVKAFTGYFGSVEAGAAHDATELMNTSGPFPDLGEILIDQGGADNFLADQLCPEAFKAACAAKGQPLRLRMQAGYDHSYFFISTFVGDHIQFHATALGKKSRAALEAAHEAEFPVCAPATLAPTAGQPIKCKGMVAYGPKQPLKCETITVGPPGVGEVRVKVMCNALCHTDVYTWGGEDPEGLFPCILGHEAGTIVESVGPGVTSVKVGDHVVPGYTPQCSEVDCIFCQSAETNLCPKIRATQGKGVMPDGTSRFLNEAGETIYHFMGCSTMAEYTVLAEISCAKITPAMPLEKACLFGCGVATGLGAVWNTTKVKKDSIVAVFGLGAVGLSVVQAAKMAGASRIIGIDINEGKFEFARGIGATEFVNPTKLPEGVSVQQHVTSLTKWGCDYTFDCTGNVNVMRSALECAHRGWGVSCVIGVAASGKEISTRPFQLVTGRKWVGTAFGGFKTRRDIPKLVDLHLNGQLQIDHYITHTLDGIEKTNEAFDILHSGECLRCVVKY